MRSTAVIYMGNPLKYIEKMREIERNCSISLFKWVKNVG